MEVFEMKNLFLIIIAVTLFAVGAACASAHERVRVDVVRPYPYYVVPRDVVPPPPVVAPPMVLPPRVLVPVPDYRHHYDYRYHYYRPYPYYGGGVVLERGLSVYY